MSKLLPTFLGCAAIVISASAVAQAVPVAAPDNNPVKAAPPVSEKKICRTEDVTGSRLATRRVCLTATQWADRQLQDQQVISKVQTSGYTNGK